jgi:hypothetical protein
MRLKLILLFLIILGLVVLSFMMDATYLLRMTQP